MNVCALLHNFVYKFRIKLAQIQIWSKYHKIESKLSHSIAGLEGYKVKKRGACHIVLKGF
jgi:hypothetical protein